MLTKLRHSDYNQVLSLLLQTLNDIIEFDPMPVPLKQPLNAAPCVFDLTICERPVLKEMAS
jgi:hypothetical protein